MIMRITWGKLQAGSWRTLSGPVMRRWRARQCKACVDAGSRKMSTTPAAALP